MRWMLIVVVLAGCFAPMDEPAGPAEPSERPPQVIDLGAGEFEARPGDPAVLRGSAPGEGQLAGTVDLGRVAAANVQVATPCGDRALGGTGVTYAGDGPSYTFSCETEGGPVTVQVSADGMVTGHWSWEWTGA